MTSMSPEGCNQVVLRGRVTTRPEERSLPSGTRIVSLRVSVPREETSMTKGSRQSVDWVDLTVWDGRVRTRAAGWREGDVVEVHGALRRRVQRRGLTMSSRLEVEVLGGRVLKRAPVAASLRPVESESAEHSGVHCDRSGSSEDLRAAVEHPLRRGAPGPRRRGLRRTGRGERGP